MRSAIQRFSRVGGAKSLVSGMTASATSVVSPVLKAPLARASFQTTMPRLPHDDAIAHVFGTYDVVMDERYGLNIKPVQEAREKFLAEGGKVTKTPILSDGNLISTPRLANIMMFRHYATKADAVGSAPVVALTFRMFFKPPAGSKSDSLTVKDIVVPLDTTFSALAGEMQSSWQAAGNSRIPDAAFQLFNPVVPVVKFSVNDVPLAADTPISALFHSPRDVTVSVTYPASAVTKPDIGFARSTLTQTDALTLHHVANSSALPAVQRPSEVPARLVVLATAGVSAYVIFEAIAHYAM